MITYLRTWLATKRLERYRRRMHAMRVMYPPEGDTMRSLNPKSRCAVREYGPRPQ